MIDDELRRGHLCPMRGKCHGEQSGDKSLSLSRVEIFPCPRLSASHGARIATIDVNRGKGSPAARCSLSEIFLLLYHWNLYLKRLTEQKEVPRSLIFM
jgi:hypothetical protein